MTQDEWIALTGTDDITETQEDRECLSKLHKTWAVEGAELPWTQLEELVGHHKISRAGVAGAGALRKVAAFAAVMAVALSIAESPVYSRLAIRWLRSSWSDRCCVAAWAFNAISAKLSNPVDLNSDEGVNLHTWDPIAIEGLEMAHLT